VVNSPQIFRNPLGPAKGIFYFRWLFSTAFLLLSLSSLAQPRLGITEAKTNFGAVKRGEVVRHDYEISNTGNAPLLLQEAEVACSCTQVDVPTQPLLPGRKATVTVTFNTKTVYGRQDRVVLLKSNDPSGPHKLRFKANVSRD
jgi:hypothetical protein